MKINYSLHTHTARCGHAQGSDEEYVLSAIENGIKVLGFSDHIFFPGISQPGIRGDYSLLSEYTRSIKSLKEKYKDKIEIYLGFECEYFDEYDSYYRELLTNGFDYLILGQHDLLENNNLVYVGEEPRLLNAQKYYNQLEKGIKSGLFLYIAHPDYILRNYKKWCKSAEELSYKICRLAKEYDIPLEINLNGIIWGKKTSLQYPCAYFWDIVSKVGNKVVIGYDAHNPNYFSEIKYINKAIKFAEKHKLKILSLNKIIKNNF